MNCNAVTASWQEHLNFSGIFERRSIENLKSNDIHVWDAYENTVRKEVVVFHSQKDCLRLESYTKVYEPIKGCL